MQNLQKRTAMKNSALSLALALGLAMVPTFSLGQALPVQATEDSQPLVTVGGQTISRGDYLAKLEMAAGKLILTKLVDTLLVRQAAAKAGVMPTEQDVDARIAGLQRSSPQLAAQAQNPATAKDFRDDLTTDIALENLRIQGVTASDAEVAAYYAKNKALFTLPSQVQTTMVVSQSAQDAHNAVLYLKEGVEPEVIAEKPGLHVAGINGFNVNMAALPPAVRQQVGQTVLAMKPGEIKTIPVPDAVQTQYFLTFKVKSAKPTSIPPLSQIKAQVARQVELQKALSPQQELTALSAANPPIFNDERYQAYFGVVGHDLAKP